MQLVVELPLCEYGHESVLRVEFMLLDFEIGSLDFSSFLTLHQIIQVLDDPGFFGILTFPPKRNVVIFLVFLCD